MDSFDKEFQEEMGEDEVRAKGKTSLSKIIDILMTDKELKDIFCFNIFTNTVEHSYDNHLLSHYAKKGTSLTDIDYSCLRTYISTVHKIAPTKVNLEDAVIHVAMRRCYHPIKDYLESLKWDEKKRLDRWLIDICGAKESAYTQAVGRKMLVAAVKRIYEPGCYYSQLVILEGRQQLNKSRLVKAIGDKWYASMPLKTHDVKTAVEEMRGKWILEIEELAGFNKQDVQFMKAFLSRQSDRVRLSYGRHAQDFPRQSIMIATMNPDKGENKYLLDNTGNVRFWPIRCRDDAVIDIDRFEKNRDHLFAEAMHLYQKGEVLWLDDKESKAQATEEQELRMTLDPWTSVIRDWLAEKEGDLLTKKITAKDIALDCLDISKERLHSGSYRRIGQIMAIMGWDRHRDSTGSREWYYTPPVREEVDWDA